LVGRRATPLFPFYRLLEPQSCILNLVAGFRQVFFPLRSMILRVSILRNPNGPSASSRRRSQRFLTHCNFSFLYFFFLGGPRGFLPLLSPGSQSFLTYLWTPIRPILFIFALSSPSSPLSPLPFPFWVEIRNVQSQPPRFSPPPKNLMEN